MANENTILAVANEPIENEDELIHWAIQVRDIQQDLSLSRQEKRKRLKASTTASLFKKRILLCKRTVFPPVEKSFLV
jgi:hypothetical protein